MTTAQAIIDSLSVWMDWPPDVIMRDLEQKYPSHPKAVLEKAVLKVMVDTVKCAVSNRPKIIKECERELKWAQRGIDDQKLQNDLPASARSFIGKSMEEAKAEYTHLVNNGTATAETWRGFDLYCSYLRTMDGIYIARQQDCSNCFHPQRGNIVKPCPGCGEYTSTSFS